MYIKAWQNKRDFAGSTRPCCGRGREGPCFGVRAAVCDFSPKAECVYPLSLVKANVAVCAGGVEDRVDNVLETLV